SVRVSDAAIKQAREYINAQFDKRYLPDEPNVHKGGRGSKVQDAHEAIRPTEVGLTPDDLKKYLERDLFKLYQLIWRRFLASQMTPAVYEATKVDFELANGKFLFRATGSGVLFDGYHALYSEAPDPTGRDRVEGPEAVVPGGLRGRVHGEHGKRAGQGRRRGPRLAGRAGGFLAPVQPCARSDRHQQDHPRGARPVGVGQGEMSQVW